MRRTAGLTAALTALIVLGDACANRPEPFMGSPTRGQMITHFDLALDARDEAITGDLDAFRRATDDLAQLEPARDLPDELMLQFGPLRWEAREAARAETVEEAARGATEIARTCGDCHRANDVGLGDTFTLGGPPPAGSTGRHMAGLAWASRLLWDGLVGPSDRTWYTGAEGLVELGALPEGLDRQVAAADVEQASARLRQLGRRATEADTPQQRVEVLGDIWATCAGCHRAR
jgi:cytochrome c553